MNLEPTTACWCGCDALEPYGPDHLRCPDCSCLLRARHPSLEALTAGDDPENYYGEHYWDKDFLASHVRSDFSSRGVFWLRAMLRHKLPPARTLELGCAPGALVALMRQAGYDATGAEMSPWAAQTAHETLQVPTIVASVESLPPEPAYDAILMFDVFEHLWQPREALKHCIDALKPDGVLAIQTPRFLGETYEEVARALFGDMLIPDHLILYTEAALRRLLAEAGFNYVVEEGHLFPYDGFFFASRQPVATFDDAQIGEALLTTPTGRFMQGYLDLYGRMEDSDRDRAARMDVINELTGYIDYLKGVCKAAGLDFA